MSAGENTKWRCTECNEVWLERELLLAPNPFDPEAGTIAGCPLCKSVGDFEHICEWADCKKAVSNGTPLADGSYVNRCWAHRPEAVGEKIKGRA